MLPGVLPLCQVFSHSELGPPSPSGLSDGSGVLILDSGIQVVAMGTSPFRMLMMGSVGDECEERGKVRGRRGGNRILSS